jgi:hypothetical protein
MASGIMMSQRISFPRFLSSLVATLLPTGARAILIPPLPNHRRLCSAAYLGTST